MDYLFRLSDGRRLALWTEKNQIIRQLSGGGGNRSQAVLRTDFLSDFTAAVMDGKICYAYQNISHRVLLCLSDGEEDRLLLTESIESCRHSRLNLVTWSGALYLFFTSWSPVRELYSVRVIGPITPDGTGETDSGTGSPDIMLWGGLREQPDFQIVRQQDSMTVISESKSFRLCSGKNGRDGWKTGSFISEDNLNRDAREREELGERNRGLLREREELKEQNRGLLREREELKEQNRGLLREREELEEQNGGLLREREELKERIAGLAGQSEKQKATIRELTQERQKREEKLREAGRQLESAVCQYNELADLTRQLQTEGKKWRERYYQESKRRKEKLAADKCIRAE